MNLKKKYFDQRFNKVFDSGNRQMELDNIKYKKLFICKKYLLRNFSEE